MNSVRVAAIAVAVISVSVAIMIVAMAPSKPQPVPKVVHAERGDAYMLCENFGGANKIMAQSVSQTPIWKSERIDVECKDGSWVSRSTWK